MFLGRSILFLYLILHWWKVCVGGIMMNGNNYGNDYELQGDNS